MATAKKTTTKPKTTTAKKPAAKKTATRTTAARAKSTTKTVAAKTTATKKPAAKKTATKASATKKAPAKRTTTTTSRAKVSKKPEFMTMQPTKETGYWLIFSMLILVLGIWVLYLTVQINQIYDQIETNNTALSTQPIVEKKKSN